MALRRDAAAVAAGVTLLFALACSTSGANASDPYAPSPEPPFGSAIHGFVEFGFANDYVTSRGLLVTNTGLTTQILSGLAFDLYKGNGLISNVTFTGGVWNDLWSEQNDPHVGSWNEFDWFAGLNVRFAKDWVFGAQIIQFQSPPHHFSTESNLEFKLGYDDSWLKLPLAFYPYVKYWYEASGSSNVVEGKTGTGYVEFGMEPTYTIRSFSRPITLTMPTWVSVGPSDYWNDGATGCGAASSTPCAKSNGGVFSTGLTGKMPLNFVSPAYGNWYAKAGFQYYYLINDSLLLAQTATGTASSYADAHRDVVVGFGKIGFTW
jgi:hypothetical protein